MMVIVLVPSFSLFHNWLYLFPALMRQACQEVDEICLQEWKIQFLVLLFVSMQVFSRSAHGISLPYPKWPRSTTTMVLWHIKHSRRTTTVNQTASIGLTLVSRDRAHTRHLKPSGSRLFDIFIHLPVYIWVKTYGNYRLRYFDTWNSLFAERSRCFDGTTTWCKGRTEDACYHKKEVFAKGGRRSIMMRVLERKEWRDAECD